MNLSMRIMVVDDEETICESLAAWFMKDGYQVDTAMSGDEALERIEKQSFDAYLVDIKMPGMDGITLLARIKEQQPDAHVIMITAHGSIQSAVEAMKLGADDYFCKPFDPEELTLLMERVMASRALRYENESLREQLLLHQGAGVANIVVASEAMQEVYRTVEEVAPTNAPVLIKGETGVGKELVARSIHMQSENSCGPLITINCGAMTETLLESELFGHEKGAFTGAVKARRGRLEMANNGTLFLDEVGEISLKMQVALLRALEEKKIQRIGGTLPIDTRFRLISATHKDLGELINENRFREDFFYRINVITIKIPPLRDRIEEIPPLADYFLESFIQETGKRIEGFTQKAIGLLMSYPWPGNVRELRNVIERAVVIARGRIIGAQELTFLRAPADQCRLGNMTLEEMEISHISAALETGNWNISKAAKHLGIDRTTLTRKIKRYQLVRP